MTSKVTLLIWFIALCSFLQEAYGDDDDCADTNLPLTNVSFTFTDEDIVIKWDLMSETNCSVEYHFTVRDSELGVILDEYLEDQFMRLDAISPCITYNVGIQVVSKASPATKGPLLTITIQLYPRAQIAPALKSLDVQSTSINMSWLLEGNKNRCPLKNFYVNGGNFFNFSVPLDDLEDRSTVPVEITPLKPNSMYYFQVSVENTGGWSPPYQIAVQTLPSN